MKITYTRNIELTSAERYILDRFEGMLRDWKEQTSYAELGDLPEIVDDCLESVKSLDKELKDTVEEW